MKPNLSSPDTLPVRAAFIGAGNFISGNHLPNMARSRLWEIYAICDINENNLARAVDRFSPRLHTADYRQLLDDPKVEVVVVGTRHDLHEKLVTECAAAGKDVFVEKPMSKTWAESESIVRAVHRAGTRLMVGYNRRFAPAMVRAKTVFLDHNRGKKALATYRAVDDSTFWPRWPFDLKDGGGKVMSEACHFFDLMSWFFEDEPVSVQCTGGREDNNLIEVNFRGGSVACIVSGGCGNDATGKERMEVFCDSTTVVMDQFLEVLFDGFDSEEDSRFPLSEDPYPEMGDADTLAGFRRRMNRWLNRGPTEEEKKAKAYYATTPRVNKGHFEELEAYARAIRSGQRSPCDEIDGARATAMSLRAIESLEDGQKPKAIRPEDYFLPLRRPAMPSVSRVTPVRTPAATRK